VAKVLEFRTHAITAAKPPSDTVAPEPPHVAPVPSPATAVTPFSEPPPDHAARLRALTADRSFLVEAPAGSGKTGLLIQRYLRLLDTPQVTDPEQVLALTFTNKAAAEMRERVLRQLRDAASGQPCGHSDFERTTRALAEQVLERNRSLGWRLLEEPQRLNLRTIDSLCAQIVRSLPLLSGGSGLASTPDAEPLFRVAAQRMLQHLGDPESRLTAALDTVLLHRDANLGDVENLLVAMLPMRDQWRSLIPPDIAQLSDETMDREVRPKIEHALSKIVCSLLSDVERAIPGDLLQRMVHLAEELAHRSGYDAPHSSMKLCGGRHAVPLAQVEHLEHWLALRMLVMTQSGLRSPKGISGKNLGIDLALSRERDPQRDTLKKLVQDLHDHVSRSAIEAALQSLTTMPPAAYTDEQWHVTKAMLRVLRQALDDLHAVFAEHRACDFAEQSLRARDALHAAGPAGTTAALGLDLQHLLVDEMQDTSIAQYDLLDLLTTGWDGSSRTLFLVGDPKQSIYIFRQARVERFLRIMGERALNGVPLDVLSLTANFRSQPELVARFNDDFSALFPADTSSRQATHAEPERLQLAGEAHFAAASPMAQRTAPAGSGSQWHAQLLPYESDIARKQSREREHRTQEAAEIRAIVEAWRSKPLPTERGTLADGRPKPWSIAILVRSRGHAGPILAELRRATADCPAIPYRGVDLERLNERPEVLDLLALTRALLHPADRVAWFALLRAPWCGLSLADLHILSGSDDSAWHRRTLHAALGERGDMLSEEGQERILRLWPILQAALAQQGRLPIAEWIERTWRSLGGALPLSNDQQKNADLYLRLLHELEEQNGEVGLAPLERRVGRLFAEASNDPDAVEIMTIHKAKGLEWDIVILPALERRSAMDKPSLLDWMELDLAESSIGALLAPIAGKGDDRSKLNEWVGTIRRRRERAERKRLFYVASTRAREELHRFVFAARTSKGSICCEMGSMLEAIQAVAEPHLLAAERNAGTAMMLQDAVTTDRALDHAPGAATADAEDTGLALAAAADHHQAFTSQGAATDDKMPAGDAPPPRWVLPLDAMETTTCLPKDDAIARPTSGERAFSPELLRRPDGSFADRTFGNVVHAFLDRIATEIASGGDATSLLERLHTWKPAVDAMLRAGGLASAQRSLLAERTLEALRRTLQDSDGVWLLQPHTAAGNEIAAITYSGEERRTLRADRIFQAGETPPSAGEDCLWIVDYKTSTTAGVAVEQFLDHEQTRYTPQLMAYAEVLRGGLPLDRVRLGLYFPLLAQFVWWVPQNGAQENKN
jgi:ATP-dependent helicase/nuclease subunit A